MLCDYVQFAIIVCMQLQDEHRIHNPLVLSLLPGHTASWCLMLFPSSFSMFWCFPVFFSVPLSLDLFCVFSLHEISLSLDPLFRTIGELQAWDWLRYPLTCDPRGRIGV